MITSLPGFFPLLKCSCCSPVQSWRLGCICTVRAVKSCGFSEVGLFTGNGPEFYLFVLLKNYVISAERPVKDKVNIPVNSELRQVTKILKYYQIFKCNIQMFCKDLVSCICSVPLLGLQRCETDPENMELTLGLEYIPSGERERHLRHRLDKGVKLGKQLGLCEPHELCSCADVNNKHT